MVSMDDAVIARLDRMGDRFEILVDPVLAQRIREEPESVNLADVLAVEMVFKDSNKGDRAPDESLQKAFKTTDVFEVAKAIIEKGEIQLTVEQRRKMQEEKRKQVVAILTRNCINPVTKNPHPPQRIEMAMEEAKVNVDPFKSAEGQVQDVLKLLRPLIPIRMEMTPIALKVDGGLYGKLIGEIRGYGKILKEEWNSSGQWICLVEIPAGLQAEFFDMLNNRTHGQIDIKLLNQ
ncbi:MAG: ribosome assembly factor SBDS [Candidatus Thermoplasmatota archaeon]|nr:ribosome assembly factor SBDS [Candidatus Thermoplasmatota archaeon]